jgi:hypothetical protein
MGAHSPAQIYPESDCSVCELIDEASPAAFDVSNTGSSAAKAVVDKLR